MRCAHLFLLLLPTVATAQATTRLVTETAVGVFASSTLAAVPARTRIASGRPLALSAAVRGASAAAGVAIGERSGHFTGLQLQYGGQVASTTTFTAGTAATTDPRAIRPAAHSYLLQLAGQNFQAFTLTMAGRLAGRARATVAVDIGADGQVEFQQAADGNTYTRTLGFRGTGVTVRITVAGLAGAGAGYGLNLTLDRAGSGSGCSLAAVGRPCRTTALTGRLATSAGVHVLGLQVRNALPGAPLAWVAGGRAVTIPLPGSPCSLWTQPLVVLVGRADRTGAAALQLRFPATTKGSAILQAVPFDPGRAMILSSNGLRVDCR